MGIVTWGARISLPNDSDLAILMKDIGEIGQISSPHDFPDLDLISDFSDLDSNSCNHNYMALNKSYGHRGFKSRDSKRSTSSGHKRFRRLRQLK